MAAVLRLPPSCDQLPSRSKGKAFSSYNPYPTTMTTFKNIVLYTDHDGRAKFREADIPLPGGSPKAILSELFPSSGFQVRHSPPGVSSDFHCTTTAQWLVVLSGEMEIGLQDGSARIFKAGEHFFSNDLLPEGAVFDGAIHGHRSRVVGNAPLTTLFIRTGGHQS